MSELKISRVWLSWNNSHKNLFAIFIMFFSIIIIYSVLSPLWLGAYVERIKENLGSENTINNIPRLKNWLTGFQHLNIPGLKQTSSFEGTTNKESSSKMHGSSETTYSSDTDLDSDTTNNVYASNEETEQTMSKNEFEEVEQEMISRKKLLRQQCTQYSSELGNTTARYRTRQRYDLKHLVMYCENYKVGSSTWAMHLLHMNNIQVANKTPIHSFVKQMFPPLKRGNFRHAFLKKGTAFITVRDPFERLVSAFMDKLSINITRNDTTWNTFGKIQQKIKRNLREERRRGLVPTFQEFATYLANVLSPDPDVMSVDKVYSKINNHWKPVYLNCAPCLQRYDIILKMETFSRDSLYLKQKLGLDIEVSYVRKGGRDGHIDQDRTLNMFNTVDIATRKRLFEIYKYDFILFGYDWTKYFRS